MTKTNHLSNFNVRHFCILTAYKNLQGKSFFKFHKVLTFCFSGTSEGGDDVRGMSEDIDKDLHKLTNETKERCAALESCLAQIDQYQKVIRP